MNKAILVIDMPKNCYECYLHNYHFCDFTGDSIEEYMNTEHKPEWCLLKPAPEKYDVLAAIENNPNYDPSYDTGHNDCIDEVLGD